MDWRCGGDKDSAMMPHVINFETVHSFLSGACSSSYLLICLGDGPKQVRFGSICTGQEGGKSPLSSENLTRTWFFRSLQSSSMD